MAKHGQPTRRQLDSLIPAIKTEEKRLEELLVEARAQADAMVRDAEKQAAERIQAARKALPALLDAERESRRGEMEKKAARSALEEETRARETESRARAAMAPAVDCIVSLVWPGGTARGDGSPPGETP